MLLGRKKSLLLRRSPSFYDLEFFLNRRCVSSRFKNLKLRIILKLFRRRRSFKYVKQIALDRLEKTIYDQLDLLTLADAYDYTVLESVSQGFFRWCKMTFLKRRRVKKTIWVDVLKMLTEKNLLMNFKINSDLREIKTLIGTMFSAFRDMKNFDFEQFDSIVNEPMREIQAMASILEDLERERIELSRDYKNVKLLVNSRLCRRENPQKLAMLAAMEETLINSQAWDPIEMRYKINWYATVVNKFDLERTIRENNFRQSLQQLQFEIDTETVCSSSVSDIYNDLCEIFKYQIANFQSRYDIEVEDIDNDINYTRLQIKKLDEHRQYLTKEIDRFHAEIKECLDKQAAERQAQIDEELERLRLEKEAELERQRLEKLKAKMAKKKAKSKK